jgi:hypothetical protein
MTRRLIACGVLTLALATACGERQQDTTAGALPTGSSSTSASASEAASSATTRCDATVLSGVIEPTDSGAGNRHGKLFVTNGGGQACTLNGYSGLQLLAEDGTAITTKVERVANPGPTAVQLAPNAKAAANLHWSVVPTGDEPVDKPCQPEARKAAAIPPDDTKPMNLNWDYGPVCGGGRIEISAFYAA